MSSRLLRFLNFHQDKLNSNGTFKPEYLAKLEQTSSPERIEKHFQVLNSRYLELKVMDETNPEPQTVYAAADFFTPEEHRQFNPDGSLKEEYVIYALNISVSESYLEQIQHRKQEEIESYNRLSDQYAARGENFGQSRMEEITSAKNNYSQLRQQYELDLLNCEDLDSLIF